MKRVALLTYGHLLDKIDSPTIQDYVDLSVSVHSVNGKIPGFIGKVPKPTVLVPPFYNKEKHDTFITILSLWTSIEPIVAFSYYGPHAEALRRKKAWFYVPNFPTNIGWWINDDYTPTWEEAFERHCYLHNHGPSSHAFPMRKPFDADGNSYIINRSEVRKIIGSIPELKRAK